MELKEAGSISCSYNKESIVFQKSNLVSKSTMKQFIIEVVSINFGCKWIPENCWKLQVQMPQLKPLCHADFRHFILLSKVKKWLCRFIWNALTSKNDSHKSKFLFVNNDKTYFVKENPDFKNNYTETTVIKMLNFFFICHILLVPIACALHLYNWFISLLKWSWMHVDIAHSREKAVSPVGQLHIPIHR